MTTATAGPGFALQKGDGNVPENFTTVLEVLDVKGPIEKTDVHEVTNQSSPNGFKEFVAGLQEGGDVTFSVNLNPSDPTHNGTTGVLADKRNKVLRNWRLPLIQGNHYIAFSALVIGWEPEAPVNGILKALCTLKTTGAPVYV